MSPFDLELYTNESMKVWLDKNRRDLSGSLVVLSPDEQDELIRIGAKPKVWHNLIDSKIRILVWASWRGVLYTS